MESLTLAAIAGAAGVALAVALVFTPLVQAWSRHLGLIDVPNVRSSHDTPTPRGGGIAILAGFAAAILLRPPDERALLAFVAGAAAIAGLGLLDDIRHLPAWPKLVVHIGVATSVVVIAEVALTEIDFGIAAIPLGALGIPFSILWLVGWINAYNFMDGVNGIAAVQAIVAGAALGVLAWQQGDVGTAFLAVALAGAAAGFLPWNFPIGRIFMGDVGSATLGFLFALLVLRLAQQVGLLTATLPLLPFLFDSSVTVVRRAWSGEKFFSTPHRSHLYQRMMRLSGSHVLVTLTWGALAAVSSAGALLAARAAPAVKFGILACVVGLHIAVAAAITWREKGGERRLA